MIRVLTLACLALAALPALAANGAPAQTGAKAPVTAGAPAQQQPVEMLGPDEQLRNGLENLLIFMGQNPPPERDEIARFLDAQIAPFFDWQYMAQLASGRMYARFNQFQRDAMADDMKRRFLTQMTLRMTKWGGWNVRFMPTRFSPQGDGAVVSVQIMEPRRLRPAEIDLYLTFDPYGWAITDIVANGVSAVSWYRDQLLLEAKYQDYQRKRR